MDGMKEVRRTKVIFNRSGGTAGSGGMTTRLTIPTSWVRVLGITEENRDVTMTLDMEKGRITIECRKIEDAAQRERLLAYYREIRKKRKPQEET